jgi:ABC-type transport system involved in multi-copper enzyme maturation permease subunit
VSSTALASSFPGLVRGELRKLVRQRSIWLLLSAAVVIGLIAGLVLSTGHAFQEALVHNQVEWFRGLNVVAFGFVTPILGGIVMLTTSARLVAMEYSTGAIRVILARGRGRLEVLLAKLTALGALLLGLMLVFLLWAIVFAGLMAAANGTSLSAVRSFPDRYWHDLGVHLTTGAISLFVCACIGVAAGAVGRSMAFGMGVAIGFFPAENFLSRVFGIVSHGSSTGLLAKLDTLQLSSNLNVLSETLGHNRESTFGRPLAPVDAVHSLTLIAAYCAVFITAAFLFSRRDIVE